MQNNSTAGAAREALSSIGGKVASTLNEAAATVKGTVQKDAAAPAAKGLPSQPAATIPKPSPQKPAASPAKPPPSLPNGTANGGPIEFVLPATAARNAEPELSEEELKAKVTASLLIRRLVASSMVAEDITSLKAGQWQLGLFSPIIVQLSRVLSPSRVKRS